MSEVYYYGLFRIQGSDVNGSATHGRVHDHKSDFEEATYIGRKRMIV